MFVWFRNPIYNSHVLMVLKNENNESEWTEFTTHVRKKFIEPMEEVLCQGEGLSFTATGDYGLLLDEDKRLKGFICFSEQSRGAITVSYLCAMGGGRDLISTLVSLPQFSESYKDILSLDLSAVTGAIPFYCSLGFKSLPFGEWAFTGFKKLGGSGAFYAQWTPEQRNERVNMLCDFFAKIYWKQKLRSDYDRLALPLSYDPLFTSELFLRRETVDRLDRKEPVGPDEIADLVAFFKRGLFGNVFMLNINEFTAYSTRFVSADDTEIRSQFAELFP